MGNLYYRNPRLLALTICLIFVAGFSAYRFLPRQEDPRLTRRAALITTLFPGADSERVESLVTEKIEKELEEIEEINLVESTSRGGISVISVELADAVGPEESEQVFSRVRDKVGDAEPSLPAAALTPVINTVDTEVDAYTYIVAVVWSGDVIEPARAHDPQDSGVPYAILRRQAESLADRLRTLAGTKQVALFGAPEEEIVGEIDAAQLAHLNLTAMDLARELRSSDAKVAAGQLRGRQSDFLLEVEGEFDTLRRIAETPILSGPDGQIVLLGDVATVKKMAVDPPSEMAFIGGRPGIAVAVRMEGNRRIDDWAETIRTAVGEFRGSMPAGIAVEVIFDQSRYVEERIAGLEGSLLLGASLVMLVILFTMGWRSALLVGSALPLTAMIVLSLMLFLGVPIHQMSITGMIIALGLLIDNAIVVVDDINRRLRDRLPAVDAVRSAVSHLAVPLASSTLTTVLAFAPIALLPGSVGEFVGTIAISVILAVVSSLFLALTVIPALTGFFNRAGWVASGAGWWRSGFYNSKLEQGYRNTLEWLFTRPARGIAVALLLPLAGFFAFPQLEEQFFPPSDRDQFQIQLRLSQQTSIEQTQRLVQKARRHILEDPAVKETHWLVGSNAPKFYYNMLGGDDGSPFFAQALVQLRSAEGSMEVIRRLQDRLDERFPEAQFIARPLEQGPPFDAPIEVHVYGPDLDQLREIGNRMRSELSQAPDVVHTRATLSDGRPKLWLDTDEEQVRLAGLDAVGVATQLQSILEGAQGGSLVEATEELPVRIRIRRDDRGDFDQVASLSLLSPAARSDNPFIPLGALGELRLVPERSAIPHRDGIRSNTVQGFLVAGVLPSTVLDEFRERLAGFELPAGYRYEFGGEAEQRDDAVGNLFASVGVLVLMMISCLVLSFNSFRMASILLFVAGLTSGGGFLALWMFGYPFGFVAITGVMGLVGLSINDSIVVLAALVERRPQKPSEAVDVIIAASRHVFSTTVTTIVGFMPLLMSGSQLWPPMVVAISGGIVGGTVIALSFVPSLYLLFSRRKRALSPAGEEALVAA